MQNRLFFLSFKFCPNIISSSKTNPESCFHTNCQSTEVDVSFYRYGFLQQDLDATMVS